MVVLVIEEKCIQALHRDQGAVFGIIDASRE